MSTYTPLLRLGVGALADVYLGLQRGAEGFERVVVMKRAFEGLGAAGHARSALISEAYVLSQIRHPNVLMAHGLEELEEGLVLVLEYVPGITLQSLQQHVVYHGAPLPWSVAVHIAAQAARGLAYIHSARDPNGEALEVVHADIAPQNLVVNDLGFTKVVDFGNAQYRDWRRRASSGTPAYCAPELLEGDEPDWRADVFSLGAVLWELLEGRPLFGAETVEETLTNVLNMPAPRPKQAPDVIGDLLSRMLGKEPRDRRIPMQEIAQSLEGVAALQTITVDQVRVYLQAELGDAFVRRLQRVRRLLQRAGSVQVPHADRLDYDMLEGTIDRTIDLLENQATRVDLIRGGKESEE